MTQTLGLGDSRVMTHLHLTGQARRDIPIAAASPRAVCHVPQ